MESAKTLGKIGDLIQVAVSRVEVLALFTSMAMQRAAVLRKKRLPFAWGVAGGGNLLNHGPRDG